MDPRAATVYRFVMRRVPRLKEPLVVREERDDGGFVLRSPTPLGERPANLSAWVERWARERSDTVAFAERSGEGWRTITWSALAEQSRAIGQALAERDLSLERPVMILSGNSIDHALMTFGAMAVGVPVVPVSVAYALSSTDWVQLRHIFDLVTPGMIFVEHAAPFAKALAALDLTGVELVASEGGGTPLSALVSTSPSERFAERAATVGPDTVAKILMTSGSTDRPKGVLTTHGMLTANQQSLAQAWPFVDDAAPVLVDWLPWSHTFGGSHNFNLVLRNGGTMYIDGGRPAPALFGRTLENLAKVAPTIQFNVPAGYAMLVKALEDDAAFAKQFFSRMEAVFYAAAALPQDVWARLDAVAERTLGHRIWLTTAWGSTETSPLVTSAHFALDEAGNIGVPVPGCELAFVPNGGKLELRVRGPNVTPGYHRDSTKTAAAFDEEGFYRIGDAGRLADPQTPARGVVFDGRVAEDFKLQTGAWVNVAEVRTGCLSAAGGLLTNAVVTGHDRDYVGLLGWLSPSAEEGAREALAARLAKRNDEVKGSSRRVARVLLLEAPPSLDAGEVTDKGYVNAAAVLANRAEQVEALHADAPGDDVLVLPD